MKSIYAIGDIHGRDYLIEKMYARIENDPYRTNHLEKTYGHSPWRLY